MKRAVTLKPGNLPSYVIGQDAYDANKLGLASMMTQKNGSEARHRWFGPMPTSVLRHVDTTNAGMAYPWGMRWSNTTSSQIDWVFTTDAGASTTVRRVYLSTYNRLTQVWNYVGFVSATVPVTTTSYSTRGFRMTYDTYTTGVVTTTAGSPNITGIGSLWDFDRINVGCRIGFGSTDPTQITNWYTISSVTSDTTIALSSNVSSTLDGVPYVIEDLRAVIATTNVTATTNGGLLVIKGLSFGDFLPAGTTVPVATTVDRLKALYWLKDSATQTQTVANGFAVQPKLDWRTQYVWAGNGTTTQQLFKYNLRAPLLALTAGASTEAFVFSTAISLALTGIASQVQNGQIANPAHVGLEDCYYFTTSTRVYRTQPLSQVVAGSTTFLTAGAQMVAQFPGGITLIIASNFSGFQLIEFSAALDRFLLVGSPARGLLTSFNTVTAPGERLFGSDSTGPFSTTSNNQTFGETSRLISTSSGYWLQDLMLYHIFGSGSTDNALSACPIGADGYYESTTGQCIVTPKMTAPGAVKMLGMSVSRSQFAEPASGTASDTLGTGNLSHGLMPTEPFFVYFRTTGIDNNTGAWTQVISENLPEVSGQEIQFKFTFRTGGTSVSNTARILGLTLVYEDDVTDDRFAFDASKSSAANKQFGFWYSSAFGAALPTLKVRITDADTGSLLVEDTTLNPTGLWERTTDGVNWAPWTNQDRTNTTTWLRYTPASIADNVKARVYLGVA